MYPRINVICACIETAGRVYEVFRARLRQGESVSNIIFYNIYDIHLFIYIMFFASFGWLLRSTSVGIRSSSLSAGELKYSICIQNCIVFHRVYTHRNLARVKKNRNARRCQCKYSWTRRGHLHITCYFVDHLSRHLYWLIRNGIYTIPFLVLTVSMRRQKVKFVSWESSFSGWEFRVELQTNKNERRGAYDRIIWILLCRKWQQPVRTTNVRDWARKVEKINCSQ